MGKERIMEVVLLERIERLGQMGDVVRVKDGFARNFLLPTGKALRATKVNLAQFEAQRAQLEAQNLERKGEASIVGDKLNGEQFIVIRQASDTGQLYGSVSTRDIAETVTENGFTIVRNQVILDRPIKELGLNDLSIRLHPEVTVTITLNIARSEEEAEAQARGEVIRPGYEDEDDEDLEASEFLDDDGDDADAEESTEEASEEEAAEETKTEE